VSGSISQNIERLSFAGLAVLCVLCAMASLSWPLGYDHGSFAWVGSVVADGGMPFRDAWDPKGPLVFVAHALIQLVLGHNTWGLRLVDLLGIAGTTFVLARHLRPLTTPRTARWLCVLFPLGYATGVYQATAQPDGWVMMMLVLAMVPAWSAEDGRSAIVGAALAGLAVGAATLVKPFYAAFLPLALVRASAALRITPDLVTRAVAATVAFVVPIAAMLTWFAANGALQDLVDNYLLYSLRVHSGILSVSRVTRVTGLIDYLRDTHYVAAMIPCVVVGVAHAWRRHRMLAIAWTYWACLAVGFVLLQNTYMVYHWMPFLPPLACFFGLGVHALLAEPELSRDTNETRAANTGYIRLFVAASVACVTFHVSIHPAFDVARFGAYMAGINDADAYAMGFTTPGPDRLAARHLREHSLPDDKLVIWGWNTSILYLSELQSPSRFGDSLALVNGPGSPERAAMRREFLAAIDREKPTFILVDEDNREMFGQPAALADFDELAQIVAHSYREEARFHSRVIYRRL
jgi:hypothetical protein